MLNTSEIKRLLEIDVSSSRKLNAKVGQRYYDGEHDIKDYRMFYYNNDGELVEDTTRSNAKISHSFFNELTEQVTSYMLSSSENPIRSRTEDKDLQEKLDSYFDKKFWAAVKKLLRSAYVKGFGYLYAYKSNDDKLKFQFADGLDVIEVKGKDCSDGEDHIIYSYKDTINRGEKIIKRIQVWDDKEISYYIESEDGGIVADPDREHNPEPHVVYEKNGELYGSPLGYIPFWRLDNNDKQESGLKRIKDLIDDYDLMQSGLTNNLVDFDKPIYMVRGFKGDNLDELITNLKTKKTIGVGDNGDLSVKTVDIPYQARLTKIQEDEKNIYKFGMGFNASQVGDGNITNVVIQSRYTLLDLKSNNLESQLCNTLSSVVGVVLDEINDKFDTGYRIEDITFEFKRIIPTNEAENKQNERTEAETKRVKVQTLLDLRGLFEDEDVAGEICNVLGLDPDKFRLVKNPLQFLDESFGDGINE